MPIFIVIFSVVLLKSVAEAGAWLQEKGRSELITKYEYQTLSTYFTDPSTNSRYNSKTFFFEMYNLYYQFGLNEKITIGLDEKWFNYLDYNQYYFEESEAYSNFEENELKLDSHYKKFENRPYSTKLFAQSSIWSGDNSVISIRPAVESYNTSYDQAFEIALLYGKSFKLGKEYSYVNLEYSVARNPDDVTEKLEATLGIAVHAKHTALIQIFCYRNVGILRDQNVDLGQFSWQIKYNDYFSLQTGYATNLNRRNEYISNAIITGFIFKF